MLGSLEDVLASLEHHVCGDNLGEVLHVDERADLVIVQDVDYSDLHNVWILALLLLAVLIRSRSYAVRLLELVRILVRNRLGFIIVFKFF